MKKLLLVLVLGGALLFPIVGLADTEGEADAVLTLTAVIDVNIDEDLGDIDVTQPMLQALYEAARLSGATAIFGEFTGSFWIEVVALTNFKVEISYTYSISGGGVLPPGTIDSVLYLLGPTGVEIAYIPVSPGVYGITNFAGVNNTPGERFEYKLKVNLDNLGDRVAGEAITFTVHVKITDTTT